VQGSDIDIGATGLEHGIAPFGPNARHPPLKLGAVDPPGPDARRKLGPLLA
jgi:hypothetical protein